MENIICFECGSDDEIHYHHVVPKRLGGTKTVPLCVDCHGKIHNIDFRNHRILTKKGLDEARKRGIKLGKIENLTAEGRISGRVKNAEKAFNHPSWESAKEFIINHRSELLNKNGKINLSLTSRKLNEEGFRTRRNSIFYPAEVLRIIDKFNL